MQCTYCFIMYLLLLAGRCQVWVGDIRQSLRQDLSDKQNHSLTQKINNGTAYIKYHKFRNEQFASLKLHATSIFRRSIKAAVLSHYPNDSKIIPHNAIAWSQKWLAATTNMNKSPVKLAFLWKAWFFFFLDKIINQTCEYSQLNGGEFETN